MNDDTQSKSEAALLDLLKRIRELDGQDISTVEAVALIESELVKQMEQSDLFLWNDQLGNRKERI
ncbi:hypothetical protein [Halalkalibacterium ligniniphilum]|uniref:hypothetical protein n=1 Tax=Halalkalibacterium ligniniphilum TaxID=1134413 RepID=UPI0003491D8C|nr:hypothetical protein [Halalkalibacterium ligniniphilum]